MNKTLLFLLLACAMLLGLAGCLSFGRGHGPVDAFAFFAAANPGIPRGATGAIDERSEPKEIRVVVPPGTDIHALVATLSLNKEATITVTSTGTRVPQQNGVTPNNFSVPVMYSIEVTGQKKPWTYRVTVREAEVNARLGALVIPPGSDLQPSFSPSVHDYSLVVPFAASQVRIEARGQASTMKSMTIDGAEIPGPAGAAAIDFRGVQEKPVVIETVAEDGTTTDSYRFTITRGAPDSNAQLASLQIDGAQLDPGFSPSALGYQVTVAFETQKLVLRARPQSPVAAVTLQAVTPVGAQPAPPLSYTGDPASGGGALVDYHGPDRLTLIVAVTAENGSLEQYLVDILRAPPDTNDLLGDLSLFIPPKTQVNLVPAFSPGRLAYIAEVPYETRQVTVSAPPQSRVASVALEPTGASGGALSTTGNPAASAQVEFRPPQARMVFAIAVIAQGGNVRRYTLDIRRAPPDQSAELGLLSVSAGVLRPIFSPRLFAYALVVPADVGQVTITAAAASPVAMVTIPGLAGATPSPRQSFTLSLDPGATVIATFVVTSQAGNVSRYTIRVTRESQGQAPPGGAEPGNPPASGGDQGGTQQGGSQQGELAMPADAGPDRVMVAARGVKVAPQDAASLARKAVARITVRYYRTNEMLTQFAVPADTRQQGDTITLSLSARSNGIAMKHDRIVEVETAVALAGNRWLSWTEAQPADDTVRIDIPFLIAGDSPLMRWPAPGSMVQVAGYVGKLTPGGRAIDKEEMDRNEKGEYTLTVQVFDARTNAAYGEALVQVKQGQQGGDRTHLFTRPILVPEGATLKYMLTVKAKNGRSWTASGTMQAWTLRMASPGAFQPLILELADDLAPSDQGKGSGG
jgi:hypothetical protein